MNTRLTEDAYEPTNGQTDAGAYSERGNGTMAKTEEKKERKIDCDRDETRRERTSKNISENTAVRMSYRLADSTAAVATPGG